MNIMDQTVEDICYDSESEDDNDEFSETERKELEIALYSQIHFDQNENLVEKCNKTEEEIETVKKYDFSTEESNKNKKDVQKNITTMFETPSQEVVCISSEESEETSVLKRENSITSNDKFLNFTPMEESVNSKIGSQIKKESTIYIDSDTSSSTTTSSGSDSDSLDSEINNDFDSDCMILDEDLSDVDGIQLHVDKHQERLLKKRSAEEDKKWEIVDEDKFGKSPSPINSRYYRGDARRCFNCREIGHGTKDCKKPQKSEICHMCGFVGHFYGACPQKMCYSCERPGHAAKDCDQKSKKRSVYTLCYRCRMYGHFVERCPDIWRQYHMTTDKDNSYKGDNKENPLKFCSNCAEEGHFGYECEEERFDRHSLPVYPFIARYDNRVKFQPSNQRKRKKEFDEKSCAQPKKIKVTKNKLKKDAEAKTREKQIKSDFSVSVNWNKRNSKRCVTLVDPTDVKKSKKTKKQEAKNFDDVHLEMLKKESESVNLKTQKPYKVKNKKDKTKGKKKITSKIMDFDEPFPRSLNNSTGNSTQTSAKQFFVRKNHQNTKTTANSKTSVFHDKSYCDPSLNDWSTSKQKRGRNRKRNRKGKGADKYTSSRGFKSTFVLP